jgi:hypothetical protein
MIVAGIATIKERSNEFQATIKSLESQVNLIEPLESKKGCYPGDAGKFYGLRKLEEGYYFTCDDDLIYPEDYVEKMIAKLNEYNNKVVVTCHGRIFRDNPIQSYYRSTATKLRCLDNVGEDQFVQIGGTGVMAFHTSLIRPKLTDFKNGYMSDIWMAKILRENNIPTLVMAHKKGWIKYQQVKDTIYDQYRDNDKVQADTFNKIFLT